MPGSPKLLGRALRPFVGGALLVIVVVAAPTAFPARAAAAPLPAGTTAVISGTPDLLAELATPVSNSFAGSGGPERGRHAPGLLLRVGRPGARRRPRRAQRLREGPDHRRGDPRKPRRRPRRRAVAHELRPGGDQRRRHQGGVRLRRRAPRRGRQHGQRRLPPRPQGRDHDPDQPRGGGRDPRRRRLEPAVDRQRRHPHRLHHRGPQLRRRRDAGEPRGADLRPHAGRPEQHAADAREPGRRRKRGGPRRQLAISLHIGGRRPRGVRDERTPRGGHRQQRRGRHLLPRPEEEDDRAGEPRRRRRGGGRRSAVDRAA